MVTDLIAPVSDLLIRRYEFPQLTADILTLAIIIALCFVVGTLVSTRIGHWAHTFFEQRLERFTPGYRMVKEIVNQFLSEKGSSPFSKGQVAKVKLFGAQVETSVTALVTSEHEDGHSQYLCPLAPILPLA